MSDNLVDLINALQIGFTLTFLVLVAMLLKTWGPQLTKKNLSRPWTPSNWLSVGIAVGFLFNAIDWSYWLLTWVEFLFDLPDADRLIEYGPVSNLFTRQLPSIYSIYCHLIAAKLMHESQDEPARVYMVPLLIFGIVSALVLFSGALFFREG